MSEEHRHIPESPLDASWQMTNPTWGRSEVPKFLRDRLSKGKQETAIDADGNIYTRETQSMWELLGFFTRDLRLGYLTSRETSKGQEWLEIAATCIAEELPESFFLSLAKPISSIEISQSRNGNLRRTQKTNRQEQSVSYEEPPKRFGKKMYGE